MNSLSVVTVLIAAGALFQPAAPAQSIWQKMKQSMKQAEQNAKAQQQAHQAQQKRANGTATANVRPEAATAAAPPVDIDSPALKALFHRLDIDGVQIGMTPEEASAITLGRNPSFIEHKMTPYVFTDLPNTPLTSGIHFQAPYMANAFMLGLTLKPMQPVVLSIARYSEYEIDHQPTGENTVAALRAKYGSESIREGVRAMETISLTWVFDGEGNLLSKAGADKVRTSCGGGFREPTSGYIQGTGLAPHWKENCGPYTLMRADLTLNPPGMLSHNGQSLPPGLVSKLGQAVIAYPLFTKTVTETRQMVLAAKAANIQKNKKAAGQVEPSL